MKWLFIIYTFSYLCFLTASSSFVVVVPSYNNAPFVEQNLESIFNQNYPNFRVIYINDASTDSTLLKVRKTVNQFNYHNKTIIIDNKTRQGSLYNIYRAIHDHTSPQEIIVLVDGDDALIGPNVLTYLNSVYSNKNMWLTFGQFIYSSTKQVGFCCEYPKEVINNNSFRSQENMPSHLKTFYSWLFKKIKKEDLMFHNHFFSMTGDLAIMLPMIEMAAFHHQFISKPLYLYNDSNPLNDHKVDQLLQTQIATYIRSLKRYKPIK